MTNCANCGRPLAFSDPEQAQRFCPECYQQLLRQSVPVATPSRLAPFRSFPLTTTLVGLNMLVFFAVGFSGGSLSNPSVEQLRHWGGNYGPLTLTSEPWRLLTTTFLHIGWIHIIANMWCLWNIGRVAENIFGRVSYLLIYLLTGISGSLLSVYLHPQRTSVGAAGAIFGLAGALITALYLSKLPISKEWVNATLKTLVLFVVLNLVIGLAIGVALPVVDNSGNIGGLCLGLVAGALLSSTLMKDPQTKHTPRA